MSHRKSPTMKPQKPTSGGLPTRKTGRRKWIILAMLITMITAGWVWSSFTSSADLAQARQLLPTDPAAAEQMAERAVISAGGNFPDAQLVQCRALPPWGSGMPH